MFQIPGDYSSLALAPAKSQVGSRISGIVGTNIVDVAAGEAFGMAVMASGTM